jgi:hypothetical protein
MINRLALWAMICSLSRPVSKMPIIQGVSANFGGGQSGWVRDPAFETKASIRCSRIESRSLPPHERGWLGSILPGARLKKPGKGQVAHIDDQKMMVRTRARAPGSTISPLRDWVNPSGTQNGAFWRILALSGKAPSPIAILRNNL